MRQHRRGKGGFSLVECIVALAIFAIMSLLIVMIFAFANKQYQLSHKIDSQTDSQQASIEQGVSATNGGDSLEYAFNGGPTVTVQGEQKKAGTSSDEVRINYFVPQEPSAAPSP